MAGKSSADKVLEEMESEVLSESAEMSDNTESANEASAPHEKKLETSQMLSDTSGIEIVSTPTTSASGNPHKNSTASKMEEPSMQTELSETGMITSASEISCEGVADSDAEEKMEHSTKTDTVVELSRSLTSAAEIGKSCAEEKETSVIESRIVSKTRISDSESPCPQETSYAVKSEAAVTEISPQPKKGKIEKFLDMISPKKLKFKKSRSKSMSPSEKTKSKIIEDTNASSEDRILSEGEAHVKSDGEKSSKSALKTVKRKLSKFNIFSGTESKSFVPREATERPEEPDVPKSKTEVETKVLEQSSTLNTPKWTKTRTSLAEVSLGGTTMTDVPSTSSSSVFSATSSRLPSAVEENTSEEAVASNLVNSPDDLISSIKEDKNTVKESEKKDGSSSEQKMETAAPENADQEQSFSEENPKCSESNDEIKSGEN